MGPEMVVALVVLIFLWGMIGVWAFFGAIFEMSSEDPLQ